MTVPEILAVVSSEYWADFSRMCLLCLPRNTCMQGCTDLLPKDACARTAASQPCLAQSGLHSTHFSVLRVVAGKGITRGSKQTSPAASRHLLPLKTAPRDGRRQSHGWGCLPSPHHHRHQHRSRVAAVHASSSRENTQHVASWRNPHNFTSKPQNANIWQACAERGPLKFQEVCELQYASSP